MHSRKRRGKGWVRTLHIYVSIFALLFMLFFGLTGFMLNHSEWFGLEDTQEETREEQLRPELLAGELDRLAIVEDLRRNHGVQGLLDAFEPEEDALRISFARPGCTTDVTISRPGGAMELYTKRGGLPLLLTEIHQGKGTGTWGHRLIDVTSVSLLLLATTGLVLWLLLPRRRWLGIAAFLLGGSLFAGVVVYCLS